MSGADQDRYLMSSEELLRELGRMAEELADLEQEREYLLLRTGVHVSESTMKGKETTIAGLQQEMQVVRGILQARGYGARLLPPETSNKGLSRK